MPSDRIREKVLEPLEIIRPKCNFSISVIRDAVEALNLKKDVERLEEQKKFREDLLDLFGVGNIACHYNESEKRWEATIDDVKFTYKRAPCFLNKKVFVCTYIKQHNNYVESWEYIGSKFDLARLAVDQAVFVLETE